MALTSKQEGFARAYVANGGNATQAAISAGYSEKTARSVGAENLTKPDIRDFIKQLKKPLQKELGITAEWIRDRLKMEATMGRGSTQAGRIRALELLGKDVGMFSDNKTGEGQGKMPIPPPITFQHKDASADDETRRQYTPVESANGGE